MPEAVPNPHAAVLGRHRSSQSHWLRAGCGDRRQNQIGHHHADWRRHRAGAEMTDNPTLIVPRRNFLVRALGFTMAGATMPISVITADDAKARIKHHRDELERAWRDYYGPSHTQCADPGADLTGEHAGRLGRASAAPCDQHVHDLRGRRAGRVMKNEC
jgi:hypothetical protein